MWKKVIEQGKKGLRRCWLKIKEISCCLYKLPQYICKIINRLSDFIENIVIKTIIWIIGTFSVIGAISYLIMPVLIHGAGVEWHKYSVLWAISATAAFVAPIGLIVAILRNRKTVEMNRAERFAKAMELVGHKAPSTRSGGIYALGELAKTDANDHVVVMQSLVAFLRTKCYKSPVDGGDRISADIEAALYVLKMREAKYDQKIAKYIYNLSNICFPENAELSSAELQEVDFTSAFFNKSLLDGVDFSASLMVSAQFKGAYINQVNFTGSDLSQARFEDIPESVEVNFTECKLDEAIFRDIDLSTAIGLTQEQLDVCTVVENVILPDGLHPPSRQDT